MINEGKSVQTVRLAGFAIKFYFKNVKKSRLKNTQDLPNSKKEKRLPNILSKEEIEEMINKTNNLKHRLVISMLYSCGLRASEVIKLRFEDINFKRNIVHVKMAKGKKDRIVMLSPKVKKELIRTGKKEGLVFESSRKGNYTIETIEKIVSNAAKKAGIKAKVTPHTLTHCFATHLLEKGVDIRYIKELLGHARIETTMIYTKVSKRDIGRIKSPLDG